MRMRALKQICLAAVQIIAIIVCLSASASAQTSTPSPQPSPTPTAGGGISFAEALRQLANRGSELLVVFQNQIESPMLPWLENLSMLLGGLVAIAAFARLWKENAGAGADLFWWFARLGVIFALIGNGPKIINGMSETGAWIVRGGDDNGVLYSLYKEQRTSFTKAYEKFTEVTFTVRDQSTQSVPGGLVGVTSSIESSLTNPDRKFEITSMSMPMAFAGLNFGRGLISFGDLFVTLLEGFLIIAMRLAAPVVIALAIDRNLAQRVTFPYLWGAVVLTLIWPVVYLLISVIAYMGGNVAMAMGDKPLYRFDERTMAIINASGSHPFFTVVLAAAIMMIAGLILWMSPYIAYQLSTGSLYEVAASTASTLGGGMQYYATSIAGSILQQAVMPQSGGANRIPRLPIPFNPNAIPGVGGKPLRLPPFVPGLKRPGEGDGNPPPPPPSNPAGRGSFTEY
jgi:hypothetical protein